jgi:iron(III) transport system permease protein
VAPGFIEEHSSRGRRIATRLFGLAFVSLVILLAVGIPIGRLVHDAFGRDGRLLFHAKEAVTRASLDLRHSLTFGVLAAIGMALLAGILGHHMVRKGPRRESLILTLAFLPLAFGPIMFGAGLIRTWNQPFLETAGRWNPIYQTGIIVVFMLVGKYLPFALAAVTSTMRRIDPGYEEAAAVSGVRWGRRMLEIVSPLAARGIFSVRELDTVVLLTAGNRTVMMKIYTWVHVAHDADVAALSLVLVVLITTPFVLWSIFTARRIRVL